MEQGLDLSGRSVLVLGAGYVGGAFVRQALARGLRVAALTRNPERAAALRAAGCGEVVEADLAGVEWHGRLRRPFDFVVNCVSAGGRAVEDYRHSYVAGMRSLGRWLADRPAGGTVVYTGSTGVYPQGNGERVDEDAPLAGAGATAAVLREAEEALAVGARGAGARWFVLRLAGIYGPGRHGMLDRLRAGAAVLPGEPGHRMNLIHRDDVCGALWAALCAPAAVRDEIFNVCDGHPAPRAEVAAWLAARLGVPCPALGGSASAAGPSPSGGRRRARRARSACRAAGAGGGGAGERGLVP